MVRSFGWLMLCATACTGEILRPTPPTEPPLPGAQEPSAAPRCPDGLVVGRSPLHRLSHLEYDRTVEALFADTTRPSQQFPPEAAAAGFDHVSDVQSVSRLHAERYEAAADALAREVWARELDPGFERRFEPGHVGDGGLDTINALGWGTTLVNAPRSFYFYYRLFLLTRLEVAGDYEVGFEGWATTFADGGTLPDGGARPLFWRLHLDNQAPFYTAPIGGSAGQKLVHRAVVHLDAPGVHRFDLSVFDPENPPNCSAGQSPDAGCELNDPELGRVGAIWLSRRPQRVPAGDERVRRCELVTGGPACARQTLDVLGRRAWRRPLSAEELDRLVALYTAALNAGDGHEEAFTQVITALLLSPHFLFLVQLDADLTSTAPHRLGAHELAARLSYFLTRGPPDVELSGRADDGSLLDSSELDAQVTRLLAAPASRVMVESLGEQLLSTRDLARAAPSSALFPAFTPALKQSMAQEARLLFDEVFTKGRPTTELIDARYTFVDDPLARHYGLAPPGSATPARVALTGPERGGVLGLGSVLTLTSTATRPSPVKRGVWVLEHLMCDEPPPPPPDIPALVETAQGADALSAHTSNPQCVACHKVIDPLGLALERYDADGSRREVDRTGQPIAAVGTLPDAGRVVDLDGLRSELAQGPRFTACMAEHLLAYGLARVPTRDDRCLAATLPLEAAHDGAASLSGLTRALITSEAFRSRAPEGAVSP